MRPVQLSTNRTPSLLMGSAASPTLLGRRRQLQQKAAVAALDRRAYAIPFLDGQRLQFELTPVDDVRGDRLGDQLVGFRLTFCLRDLCLGVTLGLSDLGLRVAFRFGDVFLRFAFGLAQLVLDLDRFLDGRRLGDDRVDDRLRQTQSADETELVDFDADERDLLVDVVLDLVDEFFLLDAVDFFDGVSGSRLHKLVARQIVQVAVRERGEVVVAELDVEGRHLVGVDLVRQVDVGGDDAALLAVEDDLVIAAFAVLAALAFGRTLGPNGRLHVRGILVHRSANWIVENPTSLHWVVVDALLASGHVDDDADVSGADAGAAAAGHRADCGREDHQRQQAVALHVLLVRFDGAAAELDELG